MFSPEEVMLRRNYTPALQIGVLALFTISVAQVGYWIGDQIALARDHRDYLQSAFVADARAVTALFAGQPELLPELLPHLQIDADTGTAEVSTEADGICLDPSYVSRLQQHRPLSYPPHA